MTETDYRPEYEYTADEFVCDFDAWAVAAKAGESNTEYTPTGYFSARYSDPKEARYKLRRFGAALLYLQKHVRSQAFAEFLVSGEKLGLISRPLVEGLWRYFGGIPESRLKSEPSVDLIARLARGEDF